MHYRRKGVYISIITICLILTTSFFNTPSYAESSMDRLSGMDRYKTAAAISQDGWPSGSDYVILARGDDFADALCAAPLAKKHGAPILLTEPGKLNEDTLKELKRLGVKHIIIVGGTGAVTLDIESSLRSNGIEDVQRVAGEDRYETSVLIAERLGASSRIVLASGSSFADALSISSIAANLGMPILLTTDSSIPQKILEYIQKSQITRTYIIGGLGVIGSSVEGSIQSTHPLRLGGADRFETNVFVMKEFEKELDFANVFLAVGDGSNGDEFADALAGSVLAAMTSSPVVLVYRTIPQGTGDYLKTVAPETSIIIALGGEGAVPTTAADRLMSIISEATAGKIPPVIPPVVPAPGGGGGGAGGGIIRPNADIKTAIYISSAQPATTPMSAVNNNGTLNLGSCDNHTQVYGFYVTVGETCDFKISSAVNLNLSGIVDFSYTKTLNAGVPTLLKLDDMLIGTSGDDGVSLQTFRNNNVNSATFEGKLTKNGSEIGILTINMDL